MCKNVGQKLQENCVCRYEKRLEKFVSVDKNLKENENSEAQKNKKNHTQSIDEECGKSRIFGSESHDITGEISNLGISEENTLIFFYKKLPQC